MSASRKYLEQEEMASAARPKMADAARVQYELPRAAVRLLAKSALDAKMGDDAFLRSLRAVAEGLPRTLRRMPAEPLQEALEEAARVALVAGIGVHPGGRTK